MKPCMEDSPLKEGAARLRSTHLTHFAVFASGTQVSDQWFQDLVLKFLHWSLMPTASMTKFSIYLITHCCAMYVKTWCYTNSQSKNILLWLPTYWTPSTGKEALFLGGPVHLTKFGHPVLRSEFWKLGTVQTLNMSVFLAWTVLSKTSMTKAKYMLFDCHPSQFEQESAQMGVKLVLNITSMATTGLRYILCEVMVLSNSSDGTVDSNSK